jgi:hypothetical protein
MTMMLYADGTKEIWCHKFPGIIFFELPLPPPPPPSNDDDDGWWLMLA